MAFQLQEVSKEDFPEVCRCMWETYENPVQHLFRIFAPLNAVGATNREEAVQESTTRFWEWHVSDPSSHWQKVVESSTGKVVGGALWKINKSDPYAEPQEEEEAYWHPEGGQRDFANQVIESHEAARAQFARRPHVYLNIIFTHPSHQKQGIGKMIMDWGISKATELDMEMWLNAWRHGKSLYEKAGFVTVEHHITQPKPKAKPNEAWQTCEREWTDLEEWVMWRPKDGPYVEGKSVRPWEVSTA